MMQLGGLGSAAFADEVLDILKGLGLGFAEVLAKAFVFDQEGAFPEQVNVAVLAGNAADRFLEAGDDAAAEAKHLEELVPKGLLLGGLAFRAGPIVGEADGVVANFVPGNRHGEQDRAGGWVDAMLSNFWRA